MSLWFFNIFFGRVVRQVNEKLSWREMKLTDENGRGGEIKQILYADDTVLVAETREHFQHIVNEFNYYYYFY